MVMLPPWSLGEEVVEAETAKATAGPALPGMCTSPTAAHPVQLFLVKSAKSKNRVRKS